MVQDHAVFVAKAWYCPEKSGLICTHEGFYLVFRDDNIVLFLVGKCGGCVLSRFGYFCWLDSLVLAAYVPLLGFLGFREVLSNVFDIDEWPGEIISLVLQYTVLWRCWWCVDTSVDDRLMQVKFLLKFLSFFLEGEDFEGAWCCCDAFVDGLRFSDQLGGGDACLGYAGVIRVIEDKCEGSMVPSLWGGLDGSNLLGHLLPVFCSWFQWVAAWWWRWEVLPSWLGSPFDEQMSPWPMYSSLWWIQLTALKSSVKTAEHSRTHWSG